MIKNRFFSSAVTKFANYSMNQKKIPSKQNSNSVAFSPFLDNLSTRQNINIRDDEEINFLIKQQKIGVRLSKEMTNKIYQYHQNQKGTASYSSVQIVQALRPLKKKQHFKYPSETSEAVEQLPGMDEKTKSSASEKEVEQFKKPFSVDYKYVEDLLKISNTAFYTLTLTAVNTYPEYYPYAYLAAFSSIVGLPLTDKALLHSVEKMLDRYIKKEGEEGKESKKINPTLFMAMVVVVTCAIMKSLSILHEKKQYDKLMSDYDSSLEICCRSNEEYIKFLKLTGRYFDELLQLEGKFHTKVINKELSEDEINSYENTQIKIIKKIANNSSNLNIQKNLNNKAIQSFESNSEKLKNFVDKKNLSTDQRYQDRFSDKTQHSLHEKYMESNKALDHFKRKIEQFTETVNSEKNDEKKDNSLENIVHYQTLRQENVDAIQKFKSGDEKEAKSLLSYIPGFR